MTDMRNSTYQKDISGGTVTGTNIVEANLQYLSKL